MFANPFTCMVLKQQVSGKSGFSAKYGPKRRNTTADVLKITQLKLLAHCRIDERSSH